MAKAIFSGSNFFSIKNKPFFRTRLWQEPVKEVYYRKGKNGIKFL